MRPALRTRTVALLSTLLGVGAAFYFRDELTWNVLVARLLFHTHGFRRQHRRFAQNIRYGAGVRNRLDIYSPTKTEQNPVLIWVHGGSWNSGDKQLYVPLAARLVPNGIITVLVNYGLYPQVIHPQQAQDVATAIGWTLRNIHYFGGDPKQVFVCGHSAGAHLTALALLDERFCSAQRFTPQDLAGWIGVSGPYYLPQLMRFLREERHYNGAEVVAAMGGPRHLEETSPIRYVRQEMCKSLILHGEIDLTVPVQSSYDMAQALRGAGVAVQEKYYPKTGHSEILLYGSGKKAHENGHLLHDMVKFIKPSEK
ncbi:MAG TPA: alpha/beta hydrolase [Anaerolineales bacterium]|nr:alpha/beta hydrolase [Anaerolineales bacterium]